MKTIKFTEDELEFLQQQQQAELEQTEKYLEDLKSILEKIGSPKTLTAEEIFGNDSGIRPRKPRSDKGIKRGSREKIKLEVIPKEKQAMPEASAKQAVKPSKTATPAKRKKRSWRSSKKSKGVFLAPLRKPLVLKEPGKQESEETAADKKE